MELLPGRPEPGRSQSGRPRWRRCWSPLQIVPLVRCLRSRPWSAHRCSHLACRSRPPCTISFRVAFCTAAPSAGTGAEVEVHQADSCPGRWYHRGRQGVVCRHRSWLRCRPCPGSIQVSASTNSWLNRTQDGHAGLAGRVAAQVPGQLGGGGLWPAWSGLRRSLSRHVGRAGRDRVGDLDAAQQVAAGVVRQDLTPACRQGRRCRPGSG